MLQTLQRVTVLNSVVNDNTMLSVYTNIPKHRKCGVFSSIFNIKMDTQKFTSFDVF